MPFLTISHVTDYRYRQRVAFGDHRMMVRPLESHDQRLIDATLRIDPVPSRVRWLHDVFGNSVAIASFDTMASSLRFESIVRLEHMPGEPHTTELEEYARCYPFTYASEDMPDLLRSIERQHHDHDRQVDRWARQFLAPTGHQTDTLAMLTEMTKAIRATFTYAARHEKGTQTPTETLRKRGGTCRDYAVLMIEAVRSLGFAARFVSGYVYNPTPRQRVVGGGSTHAWVRIFLPGSGWVEFDPTNGIVGNKGLIRVAVTRDPYQALPLSGTWRGAPGSFEAMDVSVEITLDPSGTDAEARSFTPQQEMMTVC